MKPLKYILISGTFHKGKPFYLAFRYETPAQTAQYGYLRWEVKAFEVTQETVSGPQILTSQAKEPLELYHKGILEPGRTISDKRRVVFRGDFKKADLGSPTEDWAVTKALTPISSKVATEKAKK